MMIVTFADYLKSVKHFFDLNYLENTKITRFDELTLHSFIKFIYQRTTWPYEQMSRDFYGEEVKKIFSVVNSESFK
jgi:hypothetical protein